MKRQYASILLHSVDNNSPHCRSGLHFGSRRKLRLGLGCRRDSGIGAYRRNDAARLQDGEKRGTNEQRGIRHPLPHALCVSPAPLPRSARSPWVKGNLGLNWKGIFLLGNQSGVGHSLRASLTCLRFTSGFGSPRSAPLTTLRNASR